MSVVVPGNGLVESQARFEAAARIVLPKLRSYARLLTHNEAGSDDLVQETMVRAWAARGQFQPGTNFNAWLFRIARNAFLTAMRRSRRSVAFDAVAHGHLLVGAAAQENGIHQHDFARAVAMLPAPQREAFLLVADEGVTYAEAAAIQRIQLGTLKSRVSRARSALLRQLGDMDKNAGDAVDQVRMQMLSKDEARPITRRLSYQEWKSSGRRLIG